MTNQGGPLPRDARTGPGERRRDGGRVHLEDRGLRGRRGEEVAGRRLLREAPGERYADAEVDRRVASRPCGRRALVAGVGATLLVALILGVAVGVFSLSGGLLVLAPLGGLLIGGSVRRAAWSGLEHRPDPTIPILAAALAVCAWPAGLVVEYVLSLLLLPESTVDLLDRMAAAPFTDYVAGRVGVIDVIELVLLAVLAWRAAR